MKLAHNASNVTENVCCKASVCVVDPPGVLYHFQDKGSRRWSLEVYLIHSLTLSSVNICSPLRSQM